MKSSQIQIGHQYEVQAGRNKTKISVVSFDEEKQSWACKTPNGKIIKIKDTVRFLKEVGAKQPLREIIEPKGVTAPPSGSGVARTINKPADVETLKRLGPKPLGKMSVLAAAHRVLQEEGRPMQVSEIMKIALEKQYCKVGGKTPFNTFNGGIRGEIIKKGSKSRFERIGKGLFAAR